MATATSIDPPFLVALNLTRRCNLNCAHCYLDAGTRMRGGGEMSTGEVKAVLDGIASLSDEAMVVLTGGEPMLRPDTPELARHASGLGLMVVVGSNGTLIDTARAAELKEAGVIGAGISLDSLDPAYHDGFRGRPGSWEKTMASLDACRKVGLGFQIHFSVMDGNAHELDDMIAFARSAGALVLNVFFLVCTGRGEKAADISKETHEKVLRKVTRAAHDADDGEGDRMIIRAKCAPHFKRMAMELDPSWPITLAHGYEAGGCLAGTRYCRVTPEGEVTPCPYMENSAGSVLDKGFAGIWRDAPLFNALRAPKLEGRCGVCEYRKICGGCRARPMARDGDLMGEDFNCAYEPRGGAVIEPLPAPGRSGAVAWTAGAEKRLKRIPSFLRRMIRKRCEDYIREQGRGAVTVEDMQKLAKRRFGAGGPSMPGRPMPGRMDSDV
ncbi:MAG TPA: radical SAM protein [Rhodospirillales bacterium]|nr:radical SAM protein [Rhodospirillales bacterium]